MRLRYINYGSKVINGEPPRLIPEDMKDAFTLNGKIPVYGWYLNGVVPINSIEWSNVYLESFICS